MGSRNNKPGRIVKGTALQPSLKSASGVWSLDEAMQAHRANAWPQPDLFQPVSNSLRFSTAKTSYMTRTGNRGGASTTWTWSGWVKPTMYDNGAYNNVMFYAEDPAGTISMVSFEQSPNSPAYRIYVYHNSQNNETTQVFRDPSAWYHIIAIADTTNSTSGDRLRLYINGSRVTSFAASASVTQGASGGAGRPGATYWISKQGPTLARYGDSYLAEVNFIDGYALDPSLLGKFDTNNTWVPIPYTGTYGTNGFYLPFTNATTSQTLGYDASLTGTTTYDADQDPYRGSVALHLTGNGPAGGNNNVFADSSTNNLAITRNGDVTQGSFSPFSFNTNSPYNPAVHGASAYFDGSGDYLSTPASTPVNFGSGDFTMECWFYSQTSSKEQVLMGMWASDGAGIGISLHGGGGANINNVRILSGNGTWTLNTSANNIYSLNSWNHVALVRSGNTWTAYMNGVSATTITYSSAAYYNASIPFTITRAWSGAGAAYDFQGYISNVRVTKGTAIYTAAFTPTMRPFGALTNNIIRFSEDFTNSYWTVNAASITPGATIAPDGTPTGALFAWTTATAQHYIIRSSLTTSGDTVTASVYVKAKPNSAANWMIFGDLANNYMYINLLTGTIGTISQITNAAVTSVGNGWFRISGTWTSGGASSGWGAYVASADNVSNPAGTDTTSGFYIWGAQLEAGSTLGNYTPTPANFSTAPSLLLNFANAAVVDSAGANNITTVSGATITSSSKYGSGAMTFNGSTDHLTTPTNACFTYGTGDFTIEMWVYITANPGSYAYIYAQSANNTTSMSLYIQDGRFKIWNGTNVISGSTLYSLNTWYHVAISRSGTSLRLFLNGFQDGVASNNSSITTGSSFGANIGRWAEIGDGGYFNGSIDDLRVTKGLARYTLAFTPPARALPEIGGKSFVTTNVNAGVVQRFTTTGTTSWTAPTDVTNVEVLVVAGGGGTGYSEYHNGGGGAGGLIYNSSYPVTPGQTYTVTVGAGGTGGTGGAGSNNNTAGGNSIFGSLTAIGGGKGGTWSAYPGGNGGSGGGGAENGAAESRVAGTGTPGQGFNGGAGGNSAPGAGGGGGAGGPGGEGVSNSRGGNGGIGLQFGISGAPTYYAGGGGGANYYGTTNSSGGLGGGGIGWWNNGAGVGAAGSNGAAGSSNGTPNTGGGAGGYERSDLRAGANGGSGVVIVRYTTTAVGNTSDATTDNLVDSPTLYGHDTGAGGEVVGNYATLNPLQKITSPTLTNGNLSYSSSTAYAYGIGTIAIPSTGSYIFEVRYNTNTSNDNYNSGGVCTDTFIKNSSGASSTGSSNGFYGINDAGPTYGQSFVQNGTRVGSVALPAGTVVQYLINATTGVLSFTVNGVLQGTTVTLPTGVTLYPVIGEYSCSINVNFGQRAWTYAPPAGYNALTTKNLPRLAIGSAAATPNQFFDAALYTGTGAAQTITLPGAFQPDLVWMKARSAGDNHVLMDSVRGTSAALFSDLTNAEVTNATRITSFNSNGFTLGSSASVNTSSATYVAWGWKAGGTAVSNTSGTIASQVSANTTSGFSVVTYTGTGVNATVGHGLGVAPSMYICKRRNSTSPWRVYHTSLSYTTYINLSDSGAAASDSSVWNSAPTTSVFGIGTNDMNTNTGTYVAYCWAEISGFSKFGSYVGNGSADGPFVYTGFRPAFILTKDITTGSYWWEMVDSARAPFNPSDKTLYANVADSEYSGSGYNKDLLSNGFKIRGTSGGHNTSGSTYIYMAFAAKPFGNVNGVAR